MHVLQKMFFRWFLRFRQIEKEREREREREREGEPLGRNTNRGSIFSPLLNERESILARARFN